jgi:hypothetical protein
MIEEHLHLGCEFLVLEAFPRESYYKLHSLLECCYLPETDNLPPLDSVVISDILPIDLIAARCSKNLGVEVSEFAHAITSYKRQYPEFERREPCTAAEIENIHTQGALKCALPWLCTIKLISLLY